MGFFSDLIDTFGLGKYKGIPPELYSHIITDYHLTHDVALALRVFQKEGAVNNKRGKFYRIFDPDELRKKEKEKKIQLPDYDSLDKEPELIVFQCFVSTDEPITRTIEDRRVSKTPAQ
jgi:hypothetical protein